MKIEINTKYNIGDKLYHITKESNESVVLDIKYSALTKITEYLVTFSSTESNWFIEQELQNHKSF